MFIIDFKKLNKESVAIAGGKGASLGEMSQAGLSVPPGFVVVADAFERFIKETDLNVEIDSILHTVDHKEIHTVENASEKVKALILGAEMPKDIGDEIQKYFKELDSKFVAVRSSATAEDSATAAWAGQLETYLNTTEENLLENVKKCWASLFTPRAIFYRFEKGLHDQKISVAVIIQKMIESEVSGIAFSVHPVTQDYNQLIIEASFGLGEAIVSGQITPDSYVVEKEPRRIIDKNVYTQEKALVKGKTGGIEWQNIPKEKGEKQVLTNEEILELSELILKIESHYGFPVDVEWALEKDNFYITQSRPITTLSNKLSKSTRVFEKQYVRDNCLMAFQVWDQNQRIVWKQLMGWGAPTFILNARDTVTEVYYEPKMFEEVEVNVSQFLKNESALSKLICDYEFYLAKLEPIWQRRIALKNREELIDFWELAVSGWSGMSLSYFIPTLPAEYVSKKQKKLTLRLRERAGAYFEDTDRIIRLTLKKLFPKLGEFVYFISIEEIRSGNMPSKETLTERANHYIFFESKIFTAISFDDFLSKHELAVKKEEIQSTQTLTGQTAMRGRVNGKVRIVLSKKLLDTVQEGDILVTSMTTPDFLPAMRKAAAFVTDEGGITSHAAIIARELGKPCVIGTKIATQVLKDGDEVEVNADEGMVKILKRNDQKNFELHSVDYTRLFRGKAEEYFLISHIFLGYYRNFGALVTCRDNLWTSWLPKEVMQRTLREGLELLSDKNLFADYKKSFNEYKKRAKKFFDETLKKGSLTPLEVKKIFDLFSEFFVYYSKTEFFYVDEAVRRMEGNKIISENLQEHEKIKNDGREFMNQMGFVKNSYIRRFIDLLSKQLSVPYSELAFYTVEEIISLFDGKRVDTGTIRDRKENYVIDSKGGRLKIITGDDAARIIDQFIREERKIIEQKGEIKGTVANPGIVRGKVVVIPPDVREIFDNFSKFMEQMDKGDVLVAETTSPEVMPACQKASAIITNQGGLMSHAAIVSREMGIPCIVGIGNATDVLKNGDLVEVDADNGVVKIIERN